MNATINKVIRTESTIQPGLPDGFDGFWSWARETEPGLQFPGLEDECLQVHLPVSRIFTAAGGSGWGMIRALVSLRNHSEESRDLGEFWSAVARQTSGKFP